MLGDLTEVVTFRTADESDLKFIKSTFLNGLYYGSDWFQAIPRDLYKTNFEPVVDRILSKQNGWATLAVIKEEPAAIVGYAIGEVDPHGNHTLHWLYVKPDWRHKGLGKTLVPPNVIQATHLTKIGKALLRKNPSIIFNPFAI